MSAPDVAPWRRQTSQASDQSPMAQSSCENTPTCVPTNCNNGVPPAPAPPPPPPPVMNGNIPTIRLKSEIGDRCEPPAKLQNAMMKDKKPFTYTPGGIDLSEIKSPRMQRRIVRNAQTPDDVILPTTTAVNTNSLPPSAVAAMTPQIAIAVFPQNGIPKKSSPNPQPKQTPPPKQPSPPPPPQKQQIQRTIAVNSQPQQTPATQSSPPPPPQKQQIPRTVVVNSQPQQTPATQSSPPPPPQKQQIPRTIVVNSQPQQNSYPQPQQNSYPQSQQNSHPQPQQNSHPQPQQNSHPQQNSEKPKEQSRAQVGSIYIPPVTESVQSKPAFPTLREAPTPWLQKHQQPQEENKPAWVRNKNNVDDEQKELIYERKPRVQQVQVQKETAEPEKPVAGTRVIPIQFEGSTQTVNQPNSRQNSQRWATDNANVIPIQIEGANQTANHTNSRQNSQRWATDNANVIPIQIEGANQTANHTNSRPNSQRWGTDGGNQTVLNKNNVNRGTINSAKSFSEPDSKPIQSRSFKVIQKITGSEDDTTDFNSDVPYNTEGMPLSQLRKLQLCDDDQAFMNKVKSQVDEDIFLHTETDPRYRGSAIPSRAFRMLQNMTESGQVIPTTIEAQTQTRTKPTETKDTNEEAQPQKKYIPPSERQAEQEFRKYMGSSIPSRSFRMLQAMTATQETSTRPADESDF